MTLRNELIGAADQMPRRDHDLIKKFVPAVRNIALPLRQRQPNKD
jgi:hypothetical protein